MSKSLYLTKFLEYMPKFDGDYKGLSRISFFIYENAQAANEGSIYGSTGFLVGMPSAVNGQVFLYAVTNRHCIQGLNPVLRFNKKDGGLGIMETKSEQWHYLHNHYDVAVLPIALDGNVVDITFADVSFLVSDKDIVDHEIDAGEDCFMIGRFVSYDGGSNLNKPSMRFGQISIMDANIVHPYSIDYPQLGYKKDQQSILLDMRARTGYSGSPVFVYRTQGSLFHKNAKEGEQKLLVTYHFMKLIGIQWGIIPDDVSGNTGSFSEKIASANPKNADDLKNMSIVCPAKYILEVLNKPELQKIRDETNKKLLEAQQNSVQLT